MRLPREVARQLRRHSMLVPGRLGVVAVSGGADSTALLRALHQLGCRVLVAHLDHSLRPDSAADAEFVQAVAAGLGLPCAVQRRDVEAYKRRRKLSLEAAAREVRHAFLREVAERQGASAIFLGHTADDQVETFLLRLIRGAGMAGLAGMKFHDGLLCRPLLGVWRAEVEAYLVELGQPWREDASNADPRFLRNRVRHELLPLLASLNPGVKQVLLREAEVLSSRQGEVEAEVLRRLGLSARQISAANDGKAVILKSGLRLEPAAPKRSRPLAFDQPLRLPALVDVPGVGSIRARGVVLHGQVPEDGSGSDIAYLDLPTVGAELRVRTRRPGDRFVPLGMSQPKKLQDFFVDEHVPLEERDRWPLVTGAGGTIVWVAGMRIDERFKVTSSTTTAIRLQLVRE
ncbi:MAG TPA: tRNA lysidine(34) synthetase TilS [Chloroflexota bacterium]